MKSTHNFFKIKLCFFVVFLTTVFSTVIHAQAFTDETLDVAAVPVTFTLFTGSKINNNIQLKWATASELNNSHFNIQRSTNSIDFKNIASVAGKGNSTSVNNYSFNDVVDQTSNLYYRLQQVDVDGKATFSSIVLIKFSKNGSMDISIYPNPVVDANFTIAVKDAPVGKYQIAITDVSGKLIYTNTFNQIGTSSTMQLQLPKTTARTIHNIAIVDNDGKLMVSKQIIIQ